MPTALRATSSVIRRRSLDSSSPSGPLVEPFSGIAAKKKSAPRGALFSDVLNFRIAFCKRQLCQAPQKFIPVADKHLTALGRLCPLDSRFPLASAGGDSATRPSERCWIFHPPPQEIPATRCGAHSAEPPPSLPACTPRR